MMPEQIHAIAIEPGAYVKASDASTAIEAAVKQRHQEVYSAFRGDIRAMRKRLDILAALLVRIADWSMHRENENDLCKWVFRGTFMNEIDAVLAEHVYPFAAVNNPPNATSE